MPTLQILVGLPGSGKSSYCINAANDGCIICNDDAVVNAVHGGIYTLYDKSLKSIYKSVENTIVTTALSAGKDVIVDRGVNNTARSRQRFIGLARSLDANVIAVVFPNETPEIHAQRRYESDNRGLSYEEWLRIARHHERQFQHPATTSEDFDHICVIDWENIKNGYYIH